MTAPTGANILGVGVDLVEIARIRAMGTRHGDRFLDKVFSDSERADMAGRADPWPGYAVRFAAKEAVSKAFGTGIGDEIGFRDIVVTLDSRGAPSVAPGPKVAALLRERGASRIHISLTHTAELAQAFAVLVA